ncbi:hypothetical protein [Faecalibacterium prausnitzii]|uniref:hypothetical protein n=1 Tax=Faecalibacterium prausnitzii TaxID=853 RepID=UPI00290C2A16|nr:hypothetical protein [Faecalibacterium prausnitzii]MDU8666401.1 hypothetical protein [Faecalibacterium prausnitzii]
MLSYRKLAMRVLGRPLHTRGIDSPRPASQRAAAFILTAAMLTTLAAPAFAETWYIENGDITISAGESGNNVTQNNNTTYGDTNTIITNQNKNTASSNTVTIETNDKNDKVEVTLKDVNIDTSSRNNAAVSVTGEGDTNIKLDGDNALKSDIYRSGIYGSGSGSLTISGGENDSLTAQGGSGANGIYSSGSLTISGGTVTANGGSGGGGDGGDGIWSSGGVTISGGSTVTANGGNGGSLVGGDGIRSGGGLTVSDGTVTAKGGNGDSKDGYGGDGIRSGGVVTISGNTVNAAGGYGGKVGGYGICSFDRVAISGGTVEAAGGNGSTGGGSGIYSSVIDLSGSLELTAKAGSPTGKALLQNGRELDLDTIKDKLGPGAKVTATDANGETKQVSIPRPVEPEESSSSSDGGSATPSAPTSPLPGLTVTDKDGQRISYTSTQSGNTLTVCVGRFTASFRISLAALRQLRAEGIDTITFQTILCSTTLSLDELLAMGGEDAEAVLTHRFTDSSLTVG